MILKKIFKKVLNTYIDKYHYMVLYLDEKIYNYDNPENIHIKHLEYKDFFKGDPCVFDKNKMILYKNRYNDINYVAYGIFDNDKLIYSTWISYKKLGLPMKSHFTLNNDEALLEDSYCHPEYRGKGIHGMINKYRIKEIAMKGKKKVIAIVLDGNIAAYKVQINSGFKDIGIFYMGKILGIPFNTFNKEKYDY